MSFDIVNRAHKPKALSEKYLNKKERELNEKIDKQIFQREVVTELESK